MDNAVLFKTWGLTSHLPGTKGIREPSFQLALFSCTSGKLAL